MLKQVFKNYNRHGYIHRCVKGKILKRIPSLCKSGDSYHTCSILNAVDMMNTNKARHNILLPLMSLDTDDRAGQKPELAGDPTKTLNWSEEQNAGVINIKSVHQ